METKKLFITGGSGYIGSNIIKAYLSHGWSATAYVRDAKKAAFLKNLGDVAIIEGNLDETDKLFSSAVGHDVVVHASDCDPKMAEETMKLLVNSCIKTAESKKSKFIFCSGCMVNGTDGKVRNENTYCDVALDFVQWKVPFEQYLISLNGKTENFSTAVIRPSWVYGLNFPNYTNDYLKYCKDQGKVPVSKLMKEENLMNFIHVEDTANCFYLVGTKDVTGIFNAADNVHVSVKDFTESIAKLLNVNIVEEQHEGPFATLCAISNQRVTTVRSEEIGWTVKYTSILEKLPTIYEELYQ